MRLVVFDLDHTLLRANSSFHFGLYLYQKSYFSTWKLLASLCDYVRHKWCGMSLLDLHLNSFFRLFNGHAQEEIRSHVSNFLKDHFSNLLNKLVWERLKAAQSAGHHVLILSSSPDFLVREIACHLSVGSWKATTYIVDSRDQFCGISRVMGGEEKAHYVTKLAQQLSIPLSSVTAYTDSSIDLPLLTLVGQPICVGPSRQLKTICIQNGWEIINEERSQ